MKLDRRSLEVDQDMVLELYQLSGRAGGAHLVVLGGVHGDEPEGIVACRALVQELEGCDAAGTVVVVPLSSPHACRARTRESPVDGANLARAFPGDPAGTSTERLARVIDEAVIAEADLLIDLHSAGRDYRMPFFAGAVDDGSPQSAESVAAAAAFGAPMLWVHDLMNPGRTLSAAWRRGIPAIYVETGGGGALDPADVEAYVRGVRVVMSRLGMRSDQGPTKEPDRVLRGGNGDTDAALCAPGDGWVIPTVKPGERVAGGSLLAELTLAETGAVTAVRAPFDGTVMMLRHRAQILSGETIAMMGPEDADH